jgi:hypothetical protein
MRWLTFIHKKSQQPAIAAVAAMLLLISGRVPDGFYTLCITKLKLNSGNMSPSSPFALFSMHLSRRARRGAAFWKLRLKIYSFAP